jgi:hypothetical protein
VHEHVPCLPQHDGLLAVHAVGIGDCDEGVDCTHVAILDRRSGFTVRATAESILACAGAHGGHPIPHASRSWRGRLRIVVCLRKSLSSKDKKSA